MPTPITTEDITKRSMLLTALYMAQEQYGYLSPPALERVAQRMGMSVGDIYETASFYSMFHLKPVGRHVIQVCEGLSCCLAEGADALLLTTEWNEFKQLDFARVYQLMRTPILMDSRNLWEPEQVRALGFTYFGIGRGNFQNGH